MPKKVAASPSPTATAAPPLFSVVVPAYKEAANLPMLIRAVVAAMRARSVELIEAHTASFSFSSSPSSSSKRGKAAHAGRRSRSPSPARRGKSSPTANSSATSSTNSLYTDPLVTAPPTPATLCEMIIVDDNSRDGSAEAVERLRLDESLPVRIIVRTTERGLSSAVLRGFAEARGRYLLCMDADMQHPPESVPDLFLSIIPNRTDDFAPAEFAIGTRYGVMPAGSASIDKDWPLYRRVISSGARLLARPLTPLSDPMTGFFAMTRTAYERADKVNAVGFKIALELYVKSRIRRHAEVPIVFGVRVHGESKLSSKVIVGYLKHLRELYGYVYPGLIPFLLMLLLVLIMLVAYAGYRHFLA